MCASVHRNGPAQRSKVIFTHCTRPLAHSAWGDGGKEVATCAGWNGARLEAGRAMHYHGISHGFHRARLCQWPCAPCMHRTGTLTRGAFARKRGVVLVSDFWQAPNASIQHYSLMHTLKSVRMLCLVYTCSVALSCEASFKRYSSFARSLERSKQRQNFPPCISIAFIWYKRMNYWYKTNLTKLKCACTSRLFQLSCNVGFLDQKIPVLVLCCSRTLFATKAGNTNPLSSFLILCCTSDICCMEGTPVTCTDHSFRPGRYPSRCASSTTTQHCMQRNMARSSRQLKWTVWWHAGRY